MLILTSYFSKKIKSYYFSLFLLCTTFILMLTPSLGHAGWSVVKIISGGVIKDSDQLVNIIVPGSSGDIKDILVPGSALFSDEQFYDALTLAIPGIDGNDLQKTIDDVTTELTKVVLKGMYYFGFDPLTDEILYTLYKSWIAEVIAKDSIEFSIHARFASLYEDHFRQFFVVPISGIRFFERQGDNDPNAITDCDKIYFPKGFQIVSKLKNGGLTAEDSDFKWLLHEIAHVKQCQDVNGRREYGIYWFQNVMSVLGVDPALAIQMYVRIDIFDKTIKQIHDALPMEQAAEECAVQAFTGVGQACSNVSTYRSKVLNAIVLNALFWEN